MGRFRNMFSSKTAATNSLENSSGKKEAATTQSPMMSPHEEHKLQVPPMPAEASVPKS